MDKRRDLYEHQDRATLKTPFYKRTRGVAKIIAFLDFLFSVRQQRNRFYYRCIQALRPTGAGIVLDLGCGGGNLIFKEFGRMVGVDLSSYNLSKAKRAYELCVQGDLVSGLCIKSNKIDLIICNDVFGHFLDDDKDRILANAYRVLKKGGSLIAVIETRYLRQEKYKAKFPDWYPEMLKEALESKGHIGMELPTEALARLTKAGLKVEDYKALSFYPGYVQGYLFPINLKYPPFDPLHAVAQFLSRYACRHWILERIMDNIFGLVNAINILRFDLDYNSFGVMVLCKK